MNIRELKALWEEHAFRPNKRLGQNFLIDKNIRDKILDALSLREGDTAVEIGSGFGVMSFEAAARCAKLYAVEKDERICGMMEPLFRARRNLLLVAGDILDVDLKSFAPAGGKLIVFGNIPYYVTTPIMEKIIREKRYVDRCYIVMQEDYADRIISSPGTKQYGSITCFVQLYTRAAKLFSITKNSFYPSPKVGSCLLRMDILERPSVEVKDDALLIRIIRKSFSERRKKIANSLPRGDFLGRDKNAWREILAKSGVDPDLRPEAIPLEDYARISDLVRQ